MWLPIGNAGRHSVDDWHTFMVPDCSFFHFVFPFYLEFFDNTVIPHLAVSMKQRIFSIIVSRFEQYIS
nr:MAG TPA: Protein of unknown function (DUF3703) [Caudoviricetes sp.]